MLEKKVSLKQKYHFWKAVSYFVMLHNKIIWHGGSWGEGTITNPPPKINFFRMGFAYSVFTGGYFIFVKGFCQITSANSDLFA